MAWPRPSQAPLQPFSKFEPDRPAAPPAQARDPQAARRARLLQVGRWISLGYLTFGFIVAAYVILKDRL